MSTIDKSKIYSDLLKLKIDLHFDNIPSPAYIQSLTFECNEQTRKVEKYYVSVKQELSQKERLFNVEKFNFESKKRQALTNNEKIKKLPTGKEREAAVEDLLENELRTLLDLENDVNGLKDVLDAIRNVQNNLKTTSSDIRLLERVMEQQINRLNIGTKEDPDVSALHNTFAELDEEEMSMNDVESATETISDESGEESSAEGLLGVTSPSDGQDSKEEVPKAEEDTIDSFLVDDSDDPTQTDAEEDSREGVGESQSELQALAEETEVDTTKTVSDEVLPGSVENKESANSKEWLDMNIMDIDMGDVLEGPIEIKEAVQSDGLNTEKKDSPTDTTKKESDPVITNKTDESLGKKKEAPALMADAPKREITDIDLDAILSDFQ